jgi:uncharacterized protein (DUF983 family)
MTNPESGGATGWTGKTYVSPLSAGLRRHCPRCGVGALFAGFLTLRETCPHCGLSYAFADAGDGPAVFVMLIVGFIVCGAALWLEVKQSPPFWVHAVLWGPLILLLAGLLLPMLKALLVAQQYRHTAAFGRPDKP